MRPQDPDDAVGVDDTTPEQRIVRAALVCTARWGVAKTSLDDIAREAGCSRATVYRLFPGGKGPLFDAVLASELRAFFAGLVARIEPAATLDDKLVEGVVHASRALRDHEALHYLIEHEPGQILPRLAFGELDRVLAMVSTAVAPLLEHHLDHDTAVRAGEWLTRVVLSYSLTPNEAFDLTRRDDAHRFVTTFVLPGLLSAAAHPSP